MRNVRTLTAAMALVASAVAAPTTLCAQDYPNRVIKMLQGFPPGGNVDAVARLLASEMSKGLGQTIVVESKPGQSGSLAAEAAARADPDGYTLLTVASVADLTFLPVLRRVLRRNVKSKATLEL